VYNQGLNSEEFEIIVVDDCSPSEEARRCLQSLANDEKYVGHLRLLKTPVNVRQGGSRNLGVKQAKGEYIVFIDQDDWLNDGALSKIKAALTEQSLDVLMVNYYDFNGTRLYCEYDYSNNSQDTLTGEEFINKNEVPWCPWCYIYRRDFLIDNQLFFEEHVRFEDADFSMKVTLMAKRMAFRPIHTIVHYKHEQQTTLVGNDSARIKDLVYMAWRTRQVALAFCEKCPQGAKAVMGHHYFMYASYLRRYVWRLPSREIHNILTTYPAEPYSNDWLTRFSMKHPHLLSYTITPPLRIMLNILWKSKRLIKK
jgi:glycosyltransferase involved in cell wall biosynthesis